MLDENKLLVRGLTGLNSLTRLNPCGCLGMQTNTFVGAISLFG